MAPKPRQGPRVNCPKCADWEHRYHELVREMMGMKREGFVPRETVNEPISAPELPAAVQQAIAQVSSPGTGTWRQLNKYAWEAKRAGIEDGQIAADILAGEQEPW